MNKIRIVKDGKHVEVTESNWKLGWLAKVGWKLEQPKAPPVIQQSPLKALIKEESSTIINGVNQQAEVKNMTTEFRQAYQVTELTLLQEQYNTMPDKRSKKAKELKKLIDSKK